MLFHYQNNKSTFKYTVCLYDCQEIDQLHGHALVLPYDSSKAQQWKEIKWIPMLSFVCKGHVQSVSRPFPFQLRSGRMNDHLWDLRFQNE